MEENKDKKEKDNEGKMIRAVVTMPPYAPHMEEVLRHPLVLGIRLNTVMPVKETLESLLFRLNKTANINLSGKVFLTLSKSSVLSLTGNSFNASAKVSMFFSLFSYL